MGGLGSGRSWHWNARSTVEGCHSIDVRGWKRDGWLEPGQWFKSYWLRDGEETGSINVRVPDKGEVVLSYRSRPAASDEWEDVEQRVLLSWTTCHLGGERPWFICSVYANDVYCGRRVAKLYAGGKLFACRHCYDLAYQSQHETPDGRALLKTQRIRERLGGGPSLSEPFPDKPKGMHWRTYWRLTREADHAERVSLAGMAQRFGIGLN